MIMENIKLSVTMPCYNHGQYVGEALEAILSQSFKPYEVIVVDDCSTDNSYEVIKKIADKNPIVKLVRNKENMGQPHASNYTRSLAAGDYIYCAAADDKILPGFFEKSMKLLGKYPQAALCSTLTYLIDENGENKRLYSFGGVVSGEACYISPEKAAQLMLRYDAWIHGNTAIYRRDIRMMDASHLPELKSFCDGFITRVMALKYGVCFVPEPLACWRKMESGYASSCSNNPDTQLDIIEKATTLMTTTYSDLFPAQYVDWWRKKQLFVLSKNLWSSAQQNQLNAMTLLKQPRSLFDKTFFMALKVLIKIKHVLAMIYFFSLYKFWPGKIIRRDIVSLFRKFRLGI